MTEKTHKIDEKTLEYMNKIIKEVTEIDMLNKILISLLEEIRHEIVSIDGLTAFDTATDVTDKITCICNRDLIELDYTKLLDKIDKVIE